MVIDTSAVVAILLGEPEAELFARAIARDTRRLMSALSMLETSTVLLARKGPSAVRELDLLLHEAGITTVSLDDAQARLARQAYESFGKGIHPAGLNVGDCCSYALSRVSGEPLLFKGADFTRTDIAAVELG